MAFHSISENIYRQIINFIVTYCGCNRLSGSGVGFNTVFRKERLLKREFLPQLNNIYTLLLILLKKSCLFELPESSKILQMEVDMLHVGVFAEGMCCISRSQ